jgi:hypothetical protein
MSYLDPAVDAALQTIGSRTVEYTLSGFSERFQRLRTRRDREPRGADDAVRLSAYMGMAAAVAEFRVLLGHLVGNRPSLIVGALWSVPLHLNHLRRLSPATAEVQRAFLGVEIAGRLAVIGAAEELLVSIVDVNSKFQAHGWVASRPHRRQPIVDEALSAMDDPTVRFCMAARVDLGYSQPIR